jgi:hypothetical protein
MKIKYKNLGLLIYFRKIQKNMFINREHNKSIVSYTPPLKNIVVYRPAKIYK